MTGTDVEPMIDTTTPEFTNEEYHAQWRELEKRFPPPVWDDVKREWMWLHEGMANGTFDPESRYSGLAVAIYNQKVVGADINWLRLTVTMSRKLGVHPERVVITGFPEA
jgi:hypothetical protein